jgi:hypothetical protein
VSIHFKHYNEWLQAFSRCSRRNLRFWLADTLAQAECIADALIAGVCDFGFLHIKAVDDTGHDRATALKVTHLLSREFHTQLHVEISHRVLTDQPDIIRENHMQPYVEI